MCLCVHSAWMCFYVHYLRCVDVMIYHLVCLMCCAKYVVFDVCAQVNVKTSVFVCMITFMC